MQTIIDTAGVLVLAWALGFGALALVTHVYVHRRGWVSFGFKAVVGGLLGLVALIILVRYYGGSWGDVLLGGGIVAAVFVVCSGLVAVFDR